LIDAERDCPAELRPELLEIVQKVDSGADLACVLVKVEYQMSFAAAAESLSPEYLDLSSGPPPFELPEAAKHGNAGIKRHFRERKSVEIQSQPTMTQAMDLNRCQNRSPYFKKLCRELEKRLG
jgi:hypothetical protein